MRSSDLIEGPVFLRLKRIIIIISRHWPWPGVALWTRERRPYVSPRWEFQPSAGEVTHISRHHTVFTVFWCCPLCFCAKSGPRVDTACDLMAHAWRPVSLLRAGPRTRQFSSGTLEASCRLLFLPELPAPCVNTPYIYIDIHRGKKECSIISWRLMNLSRSRRSFFLFFFRALSELPEEACLPKEPQPTQN